MQKEILEQLYESFELKARPGQGGMTFKYVPSDDIVDRMNKVFRGDWSTEVIESEVVGDQVLIRVRVYAKDPTNSDSKIYFHEGYASQLIAKYTQGPKTGQIIDIGNTYKSAMSKAIKTAVAKWGVGLYLEKGSVNENSGVGSWGPPNIPTEIPEIKPIEQPNIGPVDVPIAVPVAAPITTPSNIPDIPFDVPVIEPKKPDVVSNLPPVFTDDNVVVTQPVQSSGFNPPMDSIPTGKGVVENLTDVQKAAIDNIMSVHGKEFTELASTALQRTDNLPTAVENLSYPDAVKLIQYGNNLNTGS